MCLMRAHEQVFPLELVRIIRDQRPMAIQKVVSLKLPVQIAIHMK